MSLRINTNSWHYRLVRKYHDRYPKPNLCPYMRQLAGLFLGACMMGVAFLIILFFVISPLWSVLFGFPSEVTAGVTTVVYLIIGCMAMSTANSFVHFKQLTYQFDKEEPPLWFSILAYEIYMPKSGVAIEDTSFAMLLLSWARAAHDKMCPSIEFVEEDDVEDDDD